MTGTITDYKDDENPSSSSCSLSLTISAEICVCGSV